MVKPTWTGGARGQLLLDLMTERGWWTAGDAGRAFDLLGYPRNTGRNLPGLLWAEGLLQRRQMAGWVEGRRTERGSDYVPGGRGYAARWEYRVIPGAAVRAPMARRDRGLRAAAAAAVIRRRRLEPDMPARIGRLYRAVGTWAELAWRLGVKQDAPRRWAKKGHAPLPKHMARVRRLERELGF